MKRYRFWKITPEDVKVMKELRNIGFSYKEIGKRFNVSWSTANYHLNSKEKKRKLEYLRKHNKTLTKKQIREKNRKRQPYTSQYIKERYNKDEKFRRDFLTMVTRNFKKRAKNWIKLGLCSNCGRKRENKRWKTCERCREEGRRLYKNRKNRILSKKSKKIR